MTSKRVTIMIDDENDKKIRNKQANIMRKTNSTCSYSRVLNEQLRKILK